MRFLLDTHLPPRLAPAIRDAGYQCDLTGQLLSPDSADTEIAALANRLGAIVMSKDADFVDLLARGVLRTGLVRIRLRNMMAQETTAAMLRDLPHIVAALKRGEILIEMPFP